MSSQQQPYRYGNISSKLSLFCYEIEMYVNFAIVQQDMGKAVAAMLSALNFASSDPDLWKALQGCPKVQFTENEVTEDRDIDWLYGKITATFKTIQTTNILLREKGAVTQAEYSMDQDLQARGFCDAALAICLSYIQKQKANIRVWYPILGPAGYPLGIVAKDREFAEAVGGFGEDSEFESEEPLSPPY